MGSSDKQPESAERTPRGFSLVELLVVITLMAVLAWLVLPRFAGRLEGEKLPQSGDRLRSLLRMTRAQAMSDGLRYRVRFRLPDELENAEEFEPWYRFQPVVEIERDPLLAPGEFEMVTDPWALESTLYEPVRCARVRLGEYDPLDDDEFDEDAQRKVRDLEDEELFPPVVFESDGSSERATLVLTVEDEEVTVEELLFLQEEDLSIVLEVNLEGRTGQVWVQRPFIEEEKDLFRERRIRPDLRMDYTSPNVITEDNILELRLTVTRTRVE